MNCCAVIVTFNRLDLLKECIEGVINQSLQLDHILIVDNNSSDGTPEYISQQYGAYDNITYINLNENLGGAGGFYHGVKWAFEKRYDWVWMMDDDVEPERNCLEIMNQFTSRSKCLHPTKRYSENEKIFNWQGHFNPVNSKSSRMPKENFRSQEFTSVNYGCFEGMLIHREIIKKIGYPDPRFFIVGDDLIYGYLASLYTEVLYLRDPEFKKKIYKEDSRKFFGIKRPFQSAFFTYFNIRNHFLKKDYLLKHGSGSRIQINIVLFLKSLKLLIEVIFFYRSTEHLKKLLLGLKDGLKRNFDGHKKFISP